MSPSLSSVTFTQSLQSPVFVTLKEGYGVVIAVVSGAVLLERDVGMMT
jgi:hypothetical protein